MSKSCDKDTSYGISSRFQLLSRTQRQIAHALLTRPPLSYLEQAPNNSVRLECVMHAASVHPEPGSNSLKIYYIRLSVIYFLELILAFLLFEFFSMCFNEIPSHFSVL